MSTPVTVTLADHTRGDKWREITAIGPMIVNGVQPDQPLARVRMQFVSRENQKRYIIDSDPSQFRNAPAVIVNATTWEADIPEIQDFLPTYGIWDWDMEFYAGTDTSPRTFYKGFFTVLRDV